VVVTRLTSQAYSLVVARIWFRLFHQRLGFTLSDMFLILACLQVLAILCIFVKELGMGVIKENPEMSPLLLKVRPPFWGTI
jgi:hypothetical protein